MGDFFELFGLREGGQKIFGIQVGSGNTNVRTPKISGGSQIWKEFFKQFFLSKFLSLSKSVSPSKFLSLSKCVFCVNLFPS